MRILVVADIHGKFKKLEKIIKNAGSDFDLIVCPGDFTDMFDVPEEFSQTDIANLVLQKLLSIGKPVLCVPGNHDPYEIVNLFRDHKVNLHGSRRSFGKFNFVGWGGAPTPFNTLFEPTEEETKEALKEFKGTENMILVVHNPPKDTKLDAVKSGKHVGSQEIRKFIEQEKPKLVLSAHIHEAEGEDSIGKSKIFYPGPAYNGNYGIVEITNKKTSCKIRKLTS